MSDKVDSYMPLHIGDYLADTTDLTTEEHGAYLLILMALWRARESLPMHRLRPITKVSQSRWASVWSVISRFFDTTSDDLVSQGRVNRQLADAMARKRRASDRGAHGAAVRWSKQATRDARSIEQASTKHEPGVTQAIPAPFTFMNQSEGSGSKQTSDPDPSRQSSGVLPARSDGHAKSVFDLAPNWERYKMPYDATEAFRAVFAKYPNQVGQSKAASSWCAIVEAGFPGGEPALAEAIVARFKSGQLARPPYFGDAKFRPAFDTYLREFRWLDADSAPDDAASAKPAETHAQRDERARREGLERRIAAKAELEAKERAVTAAIAARAAGGAP